MFAYLQLSINEQEQAMEHRIISHQTPAAAWDAHCANQDRINAQADADQEAERDLALSRAGDFADWLDSSGCGQAYGGNFYNRELYDDADALKADERAARHMALEKLVVIALGATPYKDARIAAMDEIARRYVEHAMQPAPDLFGARAALDALTIHGVTK